jgi:cell division transport system ATP-binding protein
VIRFENVSKLYATAQRPALREVSLEIERGEFVFLIGQSGSGKSTFLRLVLKEEKPTNGRIHVAGKDLGRLANWKIPHWRRQIGTVFQDFRLLPNKTVYQNVAFALEVIGKPRSVIRRVVPGVLELVGLEGKEDRLPNELSGGEQQRVAVARAFANQPVLLIADEPTGNLDPVTADHVFHALMQLVKATRVAMLIATHNMELAGRMDRRVSLVDGKVVEMD